MPPPEKFVVWWYKTFGTKISLLASEKKPGTLQKTAFSVRFFPKICFFLRSAYITPFYGLRDTWLNGIISSPYPKVTLDTFGFLVGARLAARRTIFWPRLPKISLTYTWCFGKSLPSCNFPSKSFSKIIPSCNFPSKSFSKIIRSKKMSRLHWK